MVIMSLQAFKDEIRQDGAEELAVRWFNKDTVHAISVEEDYATFKNGIFNDYPNAEQIAIMGSGNWGFSLSPDPKKQFRPYGTYSDIDVAIISPADFASVWEEIRVYQRQNYYLLKPKQRDSLLRNGQNVYSGFVTPKWNPNRKSTYRYQYEINTDKYSTDLVGFRTVNMMFFKNLSEVVDYYIRSIWRAKVKI